MRVVLINPYELGRQPFGLAEPAAWLRQAGFEVRCLDLPQERLTAAALKDAGFVAFYLGMHTATRIASSAIPKARAFAPDAAFCAYGLYAPMNSEHLRALGVRHIIGGEYEPALAELAKSLRDNAPLPPTEGAPPVYRGRVAFVKPDRSGLPALDRYAHLSMPDGTCKVVGFVEGSRGCKHLCRHCPVVPVYRGRFRAVPVDVVMADADQQVAAGAQHVSFGDPDFLNGPTHALRLARALHRTHPELTYDITVKVEHLIRHAELLPELAATGCLFITSAVESIDDEILGCLDKGHCGGDLERVTALTREVAIHLAPTFLPFTPWTSLSGYRDLLRELVRLRLVQSVPPIQLAIRLLVPQGSYLFQLPGFAGRVEAFDPEMLGYPWHHSDPRVDALQARIQATVPQAEQEGASRFEAFRRIWALAHDALGEMPPALDQRIQGRSIPAMSEAWYCCAEPTDQQLQAI